MNSYENLFKITKGREEICNLVNMLFANKILEELEKKNHHIYKTQVIIEGSAVWIEFSIVKLGDFFLIIAEDITIEKIEEESLVHLSEYDQLTRLANRAKFYSEIIKACKRCTRNSNTLTVLMIDLDKFKEINDRHGHEAGDTILQEVATRLSSCMREVDLVARLGGDEFVILVEGAENIDVIFELSSRVIDEVNKPFEYKKSILETSVSIGIAYCTNTELFSAKEIINESDIEMYKAKRNGLNFVSSVILDQDRRQSTLYKI